MHKKSAEEMLSVLLISIESTNNKSNEWSQYFASILPWPSLTTLRETQGKCHWKLIKHVVQWENLVISLAEYQDDLWSYAHNRLVWTTSINKPSFHFKFFVSLLLLYEAAAKLAVLTLFQSAKLIPFLWVVIPCEASRYPSFFRSLSLSVWLGCNPLL